MDISIVIPTFNRESVLRQTLDNLSKVSCDYAIEIIVVNDGEPLSTKFEYPQLYIYKNPKKGVTTARNYGAARAKSEILFFMDDDMWCSKEAFDAILSFKERKLTENACFLMNWQYPQELIDKMRHEKIGRYLLASNYHTLEGRLMQKVDRSIEFMEVDSIGSCSFVISKELFDSFGGYDEAYIFQGEDIAIAKMIVEKQIAILLHTPITCFHNHRDRMDIDGMIDRSYRGYYSEFSNGQVLYVSPTKRKLYAFLSLFVFLIKILYQVLPNNSIFDTFNFKLIGILNALSRYKAYCDVREFKDLASH